MKSGLQRYTNKVTDCYLGTISLGNHSLKFGHLQFQNPTHQNPYWPSSQLPVQSIHRMTDLQNICRWDLRVVLLTLSETPSGCKTGASRLTWVAGRIETGGPYRSQIMSKVTSVSFFQINSSLSSDSSLILQITEAIFQ